jgi:pimeloyl-ACP methyl ester carboxylesterase
MRTADTDWFQGFEEQHLSVGAVTLRVRTGGQPQAPALDCGHFIPEERPQETAEALRRFLG